MANTNTRQAKRAPVTLKIKFKSATLDQFIERYSVDISHGGIFIRTKDPLPVGTTLRFEFQLKDASPLITGDGTVVWTREHDPSRSGVAPGMGVRFDRLPTESQQTLDQILAQKQAKSQKAADDEAAEEAAEGKFVETPTRVVPSPLVEGLARGTTESADGGEARPFASDADDFSEETFEEATKVAHLDALAKKSAEDREEEEGEPSMTTSTESSGPEEDEPAAEEAAEPEASEDAPDPTSSPAGDDEPTHVASRPQQDEPEESEDPLAAADAEEPTEPAAEADDSKEPEPAAPAPAAPAKRPAARSSDHSSESSRAKVAKASELVTEDRGSNLAWIAAAAALLLIVGVGGWWVLRGDGGPEVAAGVAAEDTPAESGGAGDETPAAEGAEEIGAAAPGAEDEVEEEERGAAAEEGAASATIESRPEGAVAELVGEGESGPTPMTFSNLDPERTYKVRLTLEGYEPAEITLVPGEAPEPVELEAQTRALKVDSTPSGARVFVNGRRSGMTPATIELTGSLASAERLEIELRKGGYERFETVVAADEGFDPAGELLVREVRAALEKKTVAARRPPPRKETSGKKKEGAGSSEKAGGKQKSAEKKQGGDGADEGKAEASAKKDESGGKKDGGGANEGGKESGGGADEKKDEAPKDAPDGEPVPDFMKP